MGKGEFDLMQNQAPPTTPTLLEWKPANAMGTVFEAMSPVVVDSTRCRWRICRRMKDGEEWIANHDEGLPPDTRVWPSKGMAMAAVLATHWALLRGTQEAPREAAGIQIDGNTIGQTLVLVERIESLMREICDLTVEREQLAGRVEYLKQFEPKE